MKIVVVSSVVFQLGGARGLHGYGGLQVVAWECARGLAAKGHTVSLVAPDGSYCPGVEIIPVGPAGRIDEHMAYGGFPEEKDQHGRVTRRAHQGYWQHLLGADCVIDHSWHKWSLTLKMEGRLRCPSLLVCHAPVHTMVSSPPPVDKGCVVCISRDQATHYEALFSRPARTAYNGIDPEVYKPLQTPRSNRYLFLGRFSTIKGPAIAEEVCKQAGVGLDLIGDTTITNEPGYFEHCKRLADGKQIKIIGGVPRGETVWWHSQAYGFIHSAKHFREPFGLAPVEAMACETPVLTFNNGAMRETVKHGETGFLVNTEQEMVDLIRADALSAISRKRCREWVCDNFTLGHMINRYAELCEEAVSGGW